MWNIILNIQCCSKALSTLHIQSVHHSVCPSSSPSLFILTVKIFPLFLPLSSTSAKIRAIEAKLQMMEDNPDDNYSGPSAYVYNKPQEKKRWEPYSKSHHSNQSRPFRKFRRWPILPFILEPPCPCLQHLSPHLHTDSLFSRLFTPEMGVDGLEVEQQPDFNDDHGEALKVLFFPSVLIQATLPSLLCGRTYGPYPTAVEVVSFVTWAGYSWSCKSHDAQLKCCCSGV